MRTSSALPVGAVPSAREPPLPVEAKLTEPVLSGRAATEAGSSDWVLRLADASVAVPRRREAFTASTAGELRMAASALAARAMRGSLLGAAGAGAGAGVAPAAQLWLRHRPHLVPATVAVQYWPWWPLYARLHTSTTTGLSSVSIWCCMARTNMCMCATCGVWREQEHGRQNFAGRAPGLLVGHLRHCSLDFRLLGWRHVLPKLGCRSDGRHHLYKPLPGTAQVTDGELGQDGGNLCVHEEPEG